MTDKEIREFIIGHLPNPESEHLLNNFYLANEITPLKLLNLFLSDIILIPLHYVDNNKTNYGGQFPSKYIFTAYDKVNRNIIDNNLTFHDVHELLILMYNSTLRQKTHIVTAINLYTEYQYNFDIFDNCTFFTTASDLTISCGYIDKNKLKYFKNLNSLKLINSRIDIDSLNHIRYLESLDFIHTIIDLKCLNELNIEVRNLNLVDCQIVNGTAFDLASHVKNVQFFNIRKQPEFS